MALAASEEFFHVRRRVAGREHGRILRVFRILRTATASQPLEVGLRMGKHLGVSWPKVLLSCQDRRVSKDGLDVGQPHVGVASVAAPRRRCRTTSIWSGRVGHGYRSGGTKYMESVSAGATSVLGVHWRRGVAEMLRSWVMCCAARVSAVAILWVSMCVARKRGTVAVIDPATVPSMK